MELKKALKKRIIVVLGPTASGKSELAVKLAKSLEKSGGAEIISADSRQVYTGLDIGSGKVEGQFVKTHQTNSGSHPDRLVYMYKNIPHFLIDVASPLRQFSVTRFQKMARAAILDILARGKTPIICGGTGQWIDAVVFEQTIPEVAPNSKLRAQLEKLNPAQMFAKLSKLDPVRARNIDSKNPRRLIRALEIVYSTGKGVPPLQAKPKIWNDFEIEWIGLNPGMEILEKNIAKRLKERLKNGMLKEVENLHTPKTASKVTGLSWKRLESFGLEYKFCALYLQKKITYEDLEEQLYRAIRQYAKRQMTWFKRNKEIKWR